MSDTGLDATARDWPTLHSSFRWNVSARYNIAQACCGRWADDRSRFALYYEDEAGHSEAWSFWDVQQAANRLSNVLGAMGVMAGDRVAIILPQRPETGIAHMACYQMGAIAVPVSHLFGADALEFRLTHAGVRVAIIDEGGLEKLGAVRDKLPDLKHVIGVGGARESWVREWSTLLPLASSRYVARDTAADDPAMIIYTSGTTGNPKGALIAQRSLISAVMSLVATFYGYTSAGEEGAQQSAATVSAAGQMHTDLTDIPVGALIWYDGTPIGNPFGHVAMYAGNGMVYSNGAPTGVGLIPLREPADGWGEPIIGWSSVWLPAATK